MHLHGALGDIQRAGDVLVAVSVEQALQDLLFTLGKIFLRLDQAPLPE